MPDQNEAQVRSLAQNQDETASWTLSDAKANLSRLVRRALEGRPQRIVRGGRDVVVVIAEPAYQRVTRRGRTAVELFSALQGAGLDLERDSDVGREAPL